MLLPLLCSLLVAQVPAKLDAIPSPLTLDAAAQLFRERGLDLLIADAAVASAQGDLAIARGVANPGLSGSVGQSFVYRGDCPQCGPPYFSAGLSDSNAIFDALTGKRGLRQDVARAAWESAKKSREDALRTGLAAVKGQFVTVLVAQDALRFTQDALEASRKLEELTQIRYRTGAISEADLSRAQTARMEAEQQIDTAQQTLEQAREQLVFLLGWRGPLPTFDLTGDRYERFDLPPGLADLDANRLLVEALDQRPDVVALQKQVERADAAIALARRQRIPDIGLSVQYAQQGVDNNAFTPPTVTVGLSTSLPIFYQQQGEIAKAEADARTQQLQLAKARAQVTNDVTTALSGFVASRKLVQRMEGGLLERSKRARDLVAIQYAKGAASLLEYLDAQRTYVAVNLEYTQDVAGYWAAVFKLEQATGKEFR